MVFRIHEPMRFGCAGYLARRRPSALLLDRVDARGFAPGVARHACRRCPLPLRIHGCRGVVSRPHAHHGDVMTAHVISFEQRAAARHRVNQGHVMRDEDADAVIRAQCRDDALAGRPVYVVRRLVQHQHVGIGRQRTCDLQAFRLAARQGAGPPRPVVADAQFTAYLHGLR